MTGAFRQNLLLGLRSLVRDRGVSLVAVGSLALGIAANATIFSLLQAVEFPNLIYPQPSRIVYVESRNVVRGLDRMLASVPDARDVAASTRTLEHPSLTADQSSILGDGVSRTRIAGRRVEPSFFDVMQVPASRGRVLGPADAADAIVLSDHLWRSALGADAGVVGRTIHIDGRPATVVGVMPARFDDVDFWMPWSVASSSPFARDDREYTLFARIAAAASVDDVTRELADVSARLATASPETNRDWVMYPTPMTRMHAQESRGAFVLLQAAVGFVLLIACANIANILLARGTRRQQEMALRVSLGATRGRLVGQLLTESVLLSLTGGAIGVVLALWGVRLARAIGGFPDIIDPSVNLLVLGFTTALSVLTGVVCGIVPALRAAGVAPETVLRAESARGGSTRGRLRAMLVALQIASAVVLASGGALMAQSFVHRQAQDLGFDPRGLLRADLQLTGDRYRDPAALALATDAMLTGLARSADVVAAGASAWALPSPGGAQQALTLPATSDLALSPSVNRGIEAVSPEYFTAMGTPLRLGRVFSAADRAGAAPVAVVNSELATALWPDRSPLGESLRLGAPGTRAPVVTVVGVVGSIRRSAMHDQVAARVYLPLAQYPNAALSVFVRARGDEPAVTRQLRAAVAAVDATLMVENVTTMARDLAEYVAPLRSISMMLTGFGALGVLLAALGVFGTMSYTVSQRRREMAVRSALGASRRDLVRLVLGQGLTVTLVGLVPGVGGAVLAARALGEFLYGVAPTDPVTLGAVATTLALVSIAACYRPARAAASVDPMSILRRE